MFKYKLKDKETAILVLGRQMVRLQHKEKSTKLKDIKKSGNIKKSKKISHLGHILYISKTDVTTF